jgi:hypothetical protein
MDKSAYRIRFTALWILAMIAFIVYKTMAVNDGAKEVSLLSNGEFAIYLSIMGIFAILSLLLKGRASNSTNRIAGIVFGVAQIIMFVDGITGYPTAMFNLMTGISIVALAAIVWITFRWKEKQSQV